MTTSETERLQWAADLEGARFVASMMHRQTAIAVDNPRPFVASAQQALLETPMGRLVRNYDQQAAIHGTPLGRAVAKPVEFVRSLLTRPQPLMTDQVNADGAAIVQAIDRALSDLSKLDDASDSLEDVVAALERDYLLSLTVTLTGHNVLTGRLAEWEKGGGGDFLDVASLRLVADEGVGRVHMRYVRSATDAGITTFVIGSGMESLDRYPPLQYMLYSQWFTYIYDLWEERYRERIAIAHGMAPDGNPWRRSDIRNNLFGDIRNIRNDVVHKRGEVDASANNTRLTWFENSENIEPQPEQMLSLAALFPRDELLTAPVRPEPGKRTEIPWTVAPELVDDVKRRALDLGMTKAQKREIGIEALQLWLDAHPC
ncbi:hypothetical protein [Nocardia terpenica]|uniref:Uncharacterized protein n=1 Tax=Nocardia terpenica TaxID=455432 RepID=A0A6G9YVX2_9NOCA|nr:hypothetical protein [Nocardia terpenica]QIS17310.1 hypothetical protein F6W96_02270 [Nocardia terpenica]